MSLSNYSSNLDRNTPGAADPNETKRSLDAQLEHVLGLEDGWQGPDSLAPTPAAREFFEKYFDGLQSSYWTESTPTATPAGGLHMEWSRDGSDYSADILAGGQLLLKVVAPTATDNAELHIEEPTTAMLRKFIMRGLPID
ncbi:hypothetical protein DFR67_11293 [Williamsia limnetica]|jgi:hypothetical protein|uniref:Uncharacterized protein n=1 Tax=Williamsia limnetica TaxID=882452 RepID=A0A318RII0_WILLI|nr:hypothetical protein [Williamsia limnetica]PYE14632.1 hypothetical protein DFR67_11293 [Williamsia limnetica]